MGEIFYKELNLTSSGVKLQSFTFLNLLKLAKQEFMRKFNFSQLPSGRHGRLFRSFMLS